MTDELTKPLAEETAIQTLRAELIQDAGGRWRRMPRDVLSIALSRERSATSFFRRRFSSSRALSRLVSPTWSPPYWRRQRSNVVSVIPWRRQSSHTTPPAAASCRVGAWSGAM